MKQLSKVTRKHPLPVGATVYPLQWSFSPQRGEFQDVEGKATITGPMERAHHYLVMFEGECVPVERGPLDENSMKGGSKL